MDRYLSKYNKYLKIILNLINKVWIPFIKFPVKVYFDERIIVESEKRDLKMRGTRFF